MSQDWTLLYSTDTVSEIPTLSTALFNTLRSNWSGTTAPSGMVAGQTWYNTTTTGAAAYGFHVCHVSGQEPHLIFHADKTYGGLLPLSAGANYQLTNHLYMNGGGTNHRITGLTTNSSVSSDAATVSYVSTEIQGHSHSGGTEGPNVAWNYLSGAGAAANTMLQVAYGGNSLNNRHWDANGTQTAQTVTPTYTSLASVSVWAWANEKKLIIAGAWCELWTDAILGTAHPNLKILRDTTAISGPTHYGISDAGNITIVTTSTPTTAGQYTWTLQGALDNLAGATASWYASFIIVI
jgi:hypothetical protein